MPDAAHVKSRRLRSRRAGLLFLGIAALTGQTALSADRMRDPMRPYEPRPAVAAEAQTSFTVSAIFSSRERRVAIVNGRRVGKGDTVDGATVIDISKDSLRLKYRGETIIRRLAAAGPKNRS